MLCVRVGTHTGRASVCVNEKEGLRERQQAFRQLWVACGGGRGSGWAFAGIGRRSARAAQTYILAGCVHGGTAGWPSQVRCVGFRRIPERCLLPVVGLTRSLNAVDGVLARNPKGRGDMRPRFVLGRANGERRGGAFRRVAGRGGGL